MIDISKGVELFNDADYFSAHDFFEDLWIDAGSKDRLFLQAMVQVSVGSFHLVSGNFRGARSQFTKSYRKLRKYYSPYNGIDILLLMAQIKDIISELNLYFEGKKEKIDLQRLPSLIYLNKS